LQHRAQTEEMVRRKRQHSTTSGKPDELPGSEGRAVGDSHDESFIRRFWSLPLVS
jgi:hypothetical protein